MVKQGDTWKDLNAYLHFRKEHLLLERQKVPFTVDDPTKREQAIRKLNAKIEELIKLKGVVNGDIKERSIYECSKVKHLTKMKVAVLKGELPCR